MLIITAPKIWGRGPGDHGGGDPYAIDFLRQGRQIQSWLPNSNLVRLQIPKEKFKLKLDVIERSLYQDKSPMLQFPETGGLSLRCFDTAKLGCVLLNNKIIISRSGWGQSLSHQKYELVSMEILRLIGESDVYAKARAIGDYALELQKQEVLNFENNQPKMKLLQLPEDEMNYSLEINKNAALTPDFELQRLNAITKDSRWRNSIENLPMGSAIKLIADNYKDGRRDQDLGGGEGSDNLACFARGEGISETEINLPGRILKIKSVYFRAQTERNCRSKYLGFEYKQELSEEQQNRIKKNVCGEDFDRHQDMDAIVFEVSDAEAVIRNEAFISRVVCRYSKSLNLENYTIEFLSKLLTPYVGPILIPESTFSNMK